MGVLLKGIMISPELVSVLFHSYVFMSPSVDMCPLFCYDRSKLARLGMAVRHFRVICIVIWISAAYNLSILNNDDIDLTPIVSAERETFFDLEVTQVFNYSEDCRSD